MEPEGIIRLVSFAGTALALAVWEAAAPRRALEAGRMWRWVGNLGVVAVSTLLVRLIFPVLPVALAVLIRERGWGVFPLLGLSPSLEILLGVLVLDLAIYFQHRAFHAWRPLWRLHRMHHADTYFDFTTGVRFHPLEIILSMAFKLALVMLLGPPALAVIIFEIGLNCVAMFNHANILLPERVDAVLRLAVVTPDMHRVHHSTDSVEMNRNFGFNSPWWDRLFRTYKPAPDLGHQGMKIGLNIFRDQKFRSLPRMLIMPFISPLQ
jgi:sterol desaturase/sphingolipid hydroxylase (fatty acid hydroxylase superfamily)